MKCRSSDVYGFDESLPTRKADTHDALQRTCRPTGTRLLPGLAGANHRSAIII